MGFALGQRTYFSQHPDEIMRFWEGGLAWQGALIGALVGLLLVTGVLDLGFWRLADELALVAPLVGAAG